MIENAMQSVRDAMDNGDITPDIFDFSGKKNETEPILDRSKRQADKQSRQNAVINFMKVIDQSLLEVRQFIENASSSNDEPENNNGDNNTSDSNGQDANNPIITVMKAVDQGLINLRQTFVNNTDTEETEGAIGSLSGVIGDGLSMVNGVLNQTTIYSVDSNSNVNPAEPVIPTASGQAEENTDNNDGVVVSVLKLADAEISGLRDYFFVNDTGQVDTPPADDSGSSSSTYQNNNDQQNEQQEVNPTDGIVVTVLKLADQEILDLVNYWNGDSNNNPSGNDEAGASSNNNNNNNSNNENPVIQVLKLADQEILDVVKYFNSSSNDNQQAEEAIVETKDNSQESDKESRPEVANESAFLTFMRRVDRELTDAQKYLYNITDTLSSAISGSPGSPAQAGQNAINTNELTRLTDVPIGEGTNNKDKIAGEIISSSNNDNVPRYDFQPVLWFHYDGFLFCSVNSVALTVAILSGLAIGGFLGLTELIVNTGGILRRSDGGLSFDLGSTPRKRRRRKRKRNRHRFSDRKSDIPDDHPDKSKMDDDIGDNDKDVYEKEAEEAYYMSLIKDLRKPKPKPDPMVTGTGTGSVNVNDQPTAMHVYDQYHNDWYTTQMPYQQHYATTPQPNYYSNSYGYGQSYDTYKPHHFSPYPDYGGAKYQYQYPDYPTSYQGTYSPPSNYNSYSPSSYYQYPTAQTYVKNDRLGYYPTDKPKKYEPVNPTQTNFDRDYYYYQNYKNNYEKDTTSKEDNDQYIYLDQEEVNKLEFDFDAIDEDYKILPFEYKPVDYDNYDMDEFGNLDFTKPGKFVKWYVTGTGSRLFWFRTNEKAIKPEARSPTSAPEKQAKNQTQRKFRTGSRKGRSKSVPETLRDCV